VNPVKSGEEQPAQSAASLLAFSLLSGERAAELGVDLRADFLETTLAMEDGMECHARFGANPNRFACHKNTLGHPLGTPLPAGAPHAAAHDCWTRGTVFPHLDDGGNCRSCHR
jgi:hypothetical protein